MKTAIIGYSGFVGGNLCRQFAFDDLYNSKNIESIAGKEYQLLVCSGMPAAKWIANSRPQEDLDNMHRLLDCLRKVKAKKFVLISTVDVYPMPVDVDENTPIDIENCQPYGKHRLMLERHTADLFEDMLTVRLPGLFGSGLKKNAVYDFIHNNQTDKIHCDAVFQFYYLENLWRDIEQSLQAPIKLINFAAEPVSIKEITDYAFGLKFENKPDYQPPRYDFKTVLAGIYGKAGDYLYSKRQILDQLKEFVRNERQNLQNTNR